MVKNNEPNYTPYIIGGILILLFVMLVLPTISDNTIGQTHYTTTIPVHIWWSSNPIDIATGTVGISNDYPSSSNTGAVCMPNFNLGSGIIPGIAGNNIKVSITKGNEYKEANLGSFYLDAVTNSYDRNVKFCLTAGTYQGTISVYKSGGSIQTKAFNFVVP